MSIQTVNDLYIQSQETVVGNNEANNQGSDESIFAQSNGSAEDKTFYENFRAWTRDEDKICTDGLDDGKLGFGEKMKSIGKGFVGILKVPFKIVDGIKNAVDVCKSEDATTSDKLKAIGKAAAPVALTAAAVAATAVALPAIALATGTSLACAGVGLGVAAGAGIATYGEIKAHTAKTDGEAKSAYETVGNGLFTIAASASTATKAAELSHKAGVKIEATGNVVKDTINCIKATPDAFKVAKANYNEYKYNMKPWATNGAYFKDSTYVRNHTQEIVSENGESISYVLPDEKLGRGYDYTQGEFTNDGKHFQQLNTAQSDYDYSIKNSSRTNIMRVDADGNLSNMDVTEILGNEEFFTRGNREQIMNINKVACDYARSIDERSYWGLEHFTPEVRAMQADTVEHLIANADRGYVSVESAFQAAKESGLYDSKALSEIASRLGIK